MKISLACLLAATACATSAPRVDVSRNPAVDARGMSLGALPHLQLTPVLMGATLDALARGSVPSGANQVLCSTSSTQAAWTTPGGCGITSGAGNAVEQSMTLSGGAGVFSQAVTGQTWVTSSSHITCTVLGTSADELTSEAISVGELHVTTSDRIAGTGFTIWLYSPNGLEGTVRVECLGV